jgi:hypothetical protein
VEEAEVSSSRGEIRSQQQQRRSRTFQDFNALMGVEERIAAEERSTRREGEKLVVRVRGPSKPL